MMYSQGTDFHEYDYELAIQLGFDATEDWSNSAGKVTFILALDVIYCYVIIENKYLVTLPLFKWYGLIGLSPIPLMQRPDTNSKVKSRRSFILFIFLYLINILYIYFIGLLYILIQIKILYKLVYLHNKFYKINLYFLIFFMELIKWHIVRI